MQKIKYSFYGSCTVNKETLEYDLITYATSVKSAINHFKFQIKDLLGFSIPVKLSLEGTVVASFRDNYLTFTINGSKIDCDVDLSSYKNELDYFISLSKEELEQEELQRLWKEHQIETLGEDFEDYI